MTRGSLKGEAKLVNTGKCSLVVLFELLKSRSFGRFQPVNQCHCVAASKSTSEEPSFSSNHPLNCAASPRSYVAQHSADLVHAKGQLVCEKDEQCR